ncbi:MAG: hypothetical protein IPM98_11440 [Lewinellaceae bacterium]|nr:hypothetical protein [Lewinellaceae bacterium]
MKKSTLLAGLLAIILFSCNESSTESTQINSADTSSKIISIAGLQLDLSANPEWQHETLRLYPVLAETATQATNILPAMKTLAEGMNTPGFRITERKQFGRERDNWYNGLTVQNKSKEAIFLMAGDVVTGGNQDRVIAHDDIIKPGTVKNIAVFCVEAGRSSYYNPAASESEKRVAAFRGYYNVASPQVRQAVYSGNQQGVWNAVSQVTSANDAESSTQAYAALETENAQKKQREACLRFFEGKFSSLSNTVGVVAVSNGKVIGVDIFGQPDLFQQQFKALLHGYTAEAAAGKTDIAEANQLAANAFWKVAVEAAPTRSGTGQVGKFATGNAWVHLYSK